MVAVVVATRGQLSRPWLAAVLVSVSLVVTLNATIWLRVDFRRLLLRSSLVTELGCGLGVVVGDGWAYRAGHVFGPSQTLGVLWVLAGVVTAGVAFGAVTGAVVGAAFGPARVGDALANGVGHFDGARLFYRFQPGIRVSGSSFRLHNKALRQAR